jgi:hypothetical protein
MIFVPFKETPVPLIAVEIRFAPAEIVPPYTVIGPAMLVAELKVTSAVFVLFPIVSPDLLPDKTKREFQVKGWLKL